MLVLVAHSVGEQADELRVDERVAYRPDLEHKGPGALTEALAALRPDVLIARRHPVPSSAAAWRESMPKTKLVAVATGPELADPALDQLGIVTTSVTAEQVRDGTADTAGGGLASLVLAERTWTRLVSGADLPQRLNHARSSAGRSVAMVGAGIVNLMTALRLVREGYSVELYDACPDPRENRDSLQYGCTRGGDNARMFTLTEADDYHDKEQRPSQQANGCFDRGISDGGWRICNADALSSDDLSWVETHRSVPPWLARSYNEDIIGFNREAGGHWTSLMDTESALFENVELRTRVLRLYTERACFDAQIARQYRVGATERVLSPGEVADRHPALGDPCAADRIVGGIEVVGFTVAVHDFVERVLALLEAAGTGMHWSRRIERICWDGAGAATGLVTHDALVHADHYVLSPGAHGGDLLRGSTSAGLIHGVLGVWLTLPNVNPKLEHSLKITRTGHPAEDANVTIGRDGEGRSSMIVGSGYGWTGSDPSNIDAFELDRLFEAVDGTANHFFPRAYELAVDSGVLDASRRLCVRPWTASNLGVLEIVEVSGGGALIVTGGHNTGGFAQAPAVAAAVLAAIRGETHPMHLLYHPQRLRGPRGASPLVTTAVG